MSALRSPFGRLSGSSGSVFGNYTVTSAAIIRSHLAKGRRCGDEPGFRMAQSDNRTGRRHLDGALRRLVRAGSETGRPAGAVRRYARDRRRPHLAPDPKEARVAGGPQGGRRDRGLARRSRRRGGDSRQRRGRGDRHRAHWKRLRLRRCRIQSHLWLGAGRGVALGGEDRGDSRRDRPGRVPGEGLSGRQRGRVLSRGLASLESPGRPEGGSRSGALHGRCKAGSARACAYEALQLMDEPERGGESLAAAERSCELGDGSGCANLAFLYATGKFVRRTIVAPRLCTERRATSATLRAATVGLMADEGPGARTTSLARFRSTTRHVLSEARPMHEPRLSLRARPGGQTYRARAVALYRRGCDGTSCQP